VITGALPTPCVRDPELPEETLRSYITKAEEELGLEATKRQAV